MVFNVKVVPSSGRSGFVLDKSGGIKCFLKSAPEQGKANKELIKLIAKAVGASRADVVIVQGAISRYKKIRIDKPLTIEQLFACLGLEKQTSLF